MCRLRGQPEVVWFSSTDATSPAAICQPVSTDIARIRDLYAIAKVIKWLEGISWPP